MSGATWEFQTIHYTHGIADVSLPDPSGFFLRVSTVGNRGNLRGPLLLNLVNAFRLQPCILLSCLLGVLSIVLWCEVGEKEDIADVGCSRKAAFEERVVCKLWLRP